MLVIEAVDYSRCQAEIIEHAPFAVGGTHRRRRCENAPTTVVSEITPGDDGLIGSMSLCEACKLQLIAKLGDNFNFDPVHTGD